MHGSYCSSGAEERIWPVNLKDLTKPQRACVRKFVSAAGANPCATTPREAKRVARVGQPLLTGKHSRFREMLEGAGMYFRIITYKGKQVLLYFRDKDGRYMKLHFEPSSVYRR